MERSYSHWIHIHCKELSQNHKNTAIFPRKSKEFAFIFKRANARKTKLLIIGVISNNQSSFSSFLVPNSLFIRWNIMLKNEFNDETVNKKDTFENWVEKCNVDLQLRIHHEIQKILEKFLFRDQFYFIKLYKASIGSCESMISSNKSSEINEICRYSRSSRGRRNGRNRLSWGRIWGRWRWPI